MMDDKTRRAVRQSVIDYRDRLERRLAEIENRKTRSFEERLTADDIKLLKAEGIAI